MKKFNTVVLLVLLFALILSGCSAATTSNGPKLIETTNTTLADKFLQDNSDEQLASMFVQMDDALLSEVNFTNAKQLSSEGLYNFYILNRSADSYKWHNKNDNKFYIPVKDVTKTLDKYFDNYSFDPTKVSVATYDSKRDIFIATAACGSRGISFVEIANKRTISTDKVLVEAIYYDRCDDPKSTKELFRKSLVVKITQDGGYKYISELIKK